MATQRKDLTEQTSANSDSPRKSARIRAPPSSTNSWVHSSTNDIAPYDLVWKLDPGVEEQLAQDAEEFAEQQRRVKEANKVKNAKQDKTHALLPEPVLPSQAADMFGENGLGEGVIVSGKVQAAAATEDSSILPTSPFDCTYSKDLMEQFDQSFNDPEYKDMLAEFDCDIPDSVTGGFTEWDQPAPDYQQAEFPGFTDFSTDQNNNWQENKPTIYNDSEFSAHYELPTDFPYTLAPSPFESQQTLSAPECPPELEVDSMEIQESITVAYDDSQFQEQVELPSEMQYDIFRSPFEGFERYQTTQAVPYYDSSPNINTHRMETEESMSPASGDVSFQAPLNFPSDTQYTLPSFPSDKPRFSSDYQSSPDIISEYMEIEQIMPTEQSDFIPDSMDEDVAGVLPAVLSNLPVSPVLGDCDYSAEISDHETILPVVVSGQIVDSHEEFLTLISSKESAGSASPDRAPTTPNDGSRLSLEKAPIVSVAAIPAEFDRFSTKSNNKVEPCLKTLSVDLPTILPAEAECSFPTLDSRVEPCSKSLHDEPPAVHQAKTECPLPIPCNVIEPSSKDAPPTVESREGEDLPPQFLEPIIFPSAESVERSFLEQSKEEKTHEPFFPHQLGVTKQRQPLILRQEPGSYAKFQKLVTILLKENTELNRRTKPRYKKLKDDDTAIELLRDYGEAPEKVVVALYQRLNESKLREFETDGAKWALEEKFKKQDAKMHQLISEQAEELVAKKLSETAVREQMLSLRELELTVREQEAKEREDDCERKSHELRDRELRLAHEEKHREAYFKEKNESSLAFRLEAAENALNKERAARLEDRRVAALRFETKNTGFELTRLLLGTTQKKLETVTRQRDHVDDLLYLSPDFRHHLLKEMDLFDGDESLALTFATHANYRDYLKERDLELAKKEAETDSHLEHYAIMLSMEDVYNRHESLLLERDIHIGVLETELSKLKAAGMQPPPNMQEQVVQAAVPTAQGPLSKTKPERFAWFRNCHLPKILSGSQRKLLKSRRPDNFIQIDEFPYPINTPGHKVCRGPGICFLLWLLLLPLGYTILFTLFGNSLPRLSRVSWLDNQRLSLLDTCHMSQKPIIMPQLTLASDLVCLLDCSNNFSKTYTFTVPDFLDLNSDVRLVLDDAVHIPSPLPSPWSKFKTVLWDFDTGRAYDSLGTGVGKLDLYL